MLTNKEYETIANKMMKARKLTYTDELFSEICLALMIADKKFNPEIGNLEGFRKYYVDNYIKNLFRRNKNYYTKHCELSDEIAVQIPAKTKTNHDMLDFVENSFLSLQQKSIIKQRFWERKKLAEIANQEKVSTERVRQIIKEAARILQDEFKEQNI